MASNITSEYYEERRAWKRNFLLIYFSETSNSPSCYVVPSFPFAPPAQKWKKYNQKKTSTAAADALKLSRFSPPENDEKR